MRALDVGEYCFHESAPTATRYGRGGLGIMGAAAYSDDAREDYALTPPSTGMLAPVMKLAAGLARKRTAAAISAGLP